MIPDYEKDSYAIADKLLGFGSVAADLSAVKKPVVLDGCRDIWCRDFMPIQTDAGFVQFLYAPSYLVDDEKAWPSITPPGAAYPSWLRDKVQVVPLVLDGGSVIGNRNVAFVSERIFPDNPSWSRREIRDALRESLCIKRVKFLPDLKDELTGHLDGSIRMVADDTVVIGTPPAVSQESPRIRRILRAASEHALKLTLAARSLGLKVIKLVDASYRAPVDPEDNAFGVYANFLQMGSKALIVPKYGVSEDIHARAQLEAEGFQVTMVDASAFVDPKQGNCAGGAINCVTWSWRS